MLVPFLLDSQGESCLDSSPLAVIASSPALSVAAPLQSLLPLIPRHQFIAVTPGI